MLAKFIIEGLQNIDEVLRYLNTLSNLVDYENVAQEELKNNIIVGKVITKLPIYRHDDDKFTEKDSLGMILQKAYPKNDLLQKHKTFGVICEGPAVISKLADVQLNTYLAIPSPRQYQPFHSNEPNFIIDQNTRCVWTFEVKDDLDETTSILVPHTTKTSPEKLYFVNEPTNSGSCVDSDIHTMIHRNMLFASDADDELSSSSGSMKTLQKCVKLREFSHSGRELESSETYFDANETFISSQVLNFQELSELSKKSLEQLFSCESENRRKRTIARLKHFGNKAQIRSVLIGIEPDVTPENPLSIVMVKCHSGGCNKTFSITKIGSPSINKLKCKHCKMVTHYVCPPCLNERGIQKLLCPMFRFSIHVLYGSYSLCVDVKRKQAEIFLGCSLNDYLANPAVSSSTILKLNKLRVRTLPEDWSEVPLLPLNLLSSRKYKNKVIVTLINTCMLDCLS